MGGEMYKAKRGEIRLATLQELVFEYSKKSDFAFLVGAGFSASTGIPTARGVVVELRRRIFCRENFGDEASMPQVKLAAINAWFVKEYGSSEDEYSQAFQIYSPSPEQRRRVIEQIIDQGEGRLNFAHLALAWMAAKGLCHYIFTTNFDPLLQLAFLRTDIIPRISDHPETGTRLELQLPTVHPRLIYLHGSYTYYDIKNLDEEVNKDNPLVHLLMDTLRKSGLIVVGYGGGNDYVMRTLEKVVAKSEYLPFPMYWVTSSDMANLSSRTRALLAGNPSRARCIPNFTADRFMIDLLMRTDLDLPPTILDPLAQERDFIKGITFSLSKDEGLGVDIIRAVLRCREREIDEAGRIVIYPLRKEVAMSYLHQAINDPKVDVSQMARLSRLISPGELDIETLAVIAILHSDPSHTLQDILIATQRAKRIVEICQCQLPSAKGHVRLYLKFKISLGQFLWGSGLMMTAPLEPLHRREDILIQAREIADSIKLKQEPKLKANRMWLLGKINEALSEIPGRDPKQDLQTACRWLKRSAMLDQQSDTYHSWANVLTRLAPMRPRSQQIRIVRKAMAIELEALRTNPKNWLARYGYIGCLLDLASLLGIKGLSYAREARHQSVRLLRWTSSSQKVHVRIRLLAAILIQGMYEPDLRLSIRQVTKALPIAKAVRDEEPLKEFGWLHLSQCYRMLAEALRLTGKRVSAKEKARQAIDCARQTIKVWGHEEDYLALAMALAECAMSSQFVHQAVPLLKEAAIVVERLVKSSEAGIAGIAGHVKDLVTEVYAACMDRDPNLSPLPVGKRCPLITKSLLGRKEPIDYQESIPLFRSTRLVVVPGSRKK